MTPPRLLVRLGLEALLIAYFVGLKWGLKAWLQITHLDGEWWARYLMSLSALQAVVGLTILVVFELWMDVLWVVRSIQRYRQGDH